MGRKKLADNAQVEVSREMVPLKKISISEKQYNWAKTVMNRGGQRGYATASSRWNTGRTIREKVA